MVSDLDEPSGTASQPSRKSFPWCVPSGRVCDEFLGPRCSLDKRGTLRTFPVWAGKIGERCAGNRNGAQPSGRARSVSCACRFGQNVRAERLRRGMSQAELGEECGLAQEYVSAVESGSLNLTIGTMVRIALALEAEVVRLLRRRR